MGAEYNDALAGAGESKRGAHMGHGELRTRVLAASERRAPPLVLDGALGTELERRGVATELPLWSARALLAAPEAVLAIHRDYVAAGAGCERCSR